EIPQGRDERQAGARREGRAEQGEDDAAEPPPAVRAERGRGLFERRIDAAQSGRGALAGLRGIDPALEEAAASLGADRWRRLGRIVLPLLRPALAAGAGLAFITALGDFVTSIVLYTYVTRPISIEILASLRLQDLGMAAVYGVLLMTASTAAFLLWGRGEAR